MGLILLSIGACILLVQPPNKYEFEHFIGFAGFVVAVVLINLAAYTNQERLRRIISIGGLLNACLAIVVFYIHPNMHGLRGLNFIDNRYGVPTRFFIATTSLLAVVNFDFIKQKMLRYIFYFIVIFYLVELARSILVLLVLVSDKYLNTIMRASLVTKFAFFFAILVFGVLASIGILIYRPDLLLSAGFKLFQLETLSRYLDHIIFGYGWGFVIHLLATSPKQPYQIEMQLPMLVIQVGLIYVSLYLLWMYWMLRSVSETKVVAFARFITYSIVGFVNPWLFLPTWYLTSALLYRNIELSNTSIEAK